MTPNGDRTGVVFGVEAGVPAADAAAARRRAHDRELGGGTMSRSGAQCPCCGAIATMEDLRLEGRAGRLGAVMTAVVVDGPNGKEYRLPTDEEIAAARVEAGALDALYAEVPFGPPYEPICADRPSPNSRGASGLPRYGFDTWCALFTDRQLLALATFVREIRRTAGLCGPAGRAPSSPSAPATGFAGGADRPGFASRAADSPLLGACAGAPAADERHENVWREALAAYLTCAVSKLADYGSAICSWHNGRELIRNTFARFALPMVWDYCEVNPLAETTGGFPATVEWVANVLEHLDTAAAGAPAPAVTRRSAIEPASGAFDLICTDPPYYDAIPYSDLMDFFHVWLRRALHGLSPAADAAFGDPLGPKWDRDGSDGELVDQPSRFAADGTASRAAYEDGMFRVFRNCRDLLGEDGRLVVVFANKQPAAWETLVSALIRAGFVVNGSWPIRTEMQNKVAGGARLASSIWLVCRKRTLTGPGWDAPVLAEMRRRIHRRLREFWDAGIRGPDFVWAATGPALEAFSQHPVVKRADAPGARLSVSAFLREVRRFVVDFVVGRVLTAGGEEAVSGLDDVTTYYLLHRYDFGLGDAPAGACILLRAVVQPVGPGAGRPPRPARARPGRGVGRGWRRRRSGRRRGGRRRRTGNRRRRGRRGPAEAVEPAEGEDAGRRRAGRPPRAADRSGPPADAALERRRRVEGERLPRRARADAPRAVRPAAAGGDRDGPGRVGGAGDSGVALEPRRRPRRRLGRAAAADAVSRRRGHAAAGRLSNGFTGLRACG